MNEEDLQRLFDSLTLRDRIKIFFCLILATIIELFHYIKFMIKSIGR